MFNDLAQQLSAIAADELITSLDHAIEKAHLKARAGDLIPRDPKGVVDLGFEDQIGKGQAIDRVAGLVALLKNLQDRETNGNALGRFLVGLKPRLLHRPDVARALTSLFNTFNFPFELQSQVYHFPFFHMNPLIDRQSLREQLHSFFEDDEDRFRLFVIRANIGVADYGRTYCRWLVQHVAKDIWGISPVYLDLRQFSTEPAGPDGIGQMKTLCGSLASELGLTAHFDNAFLNTPLRQALQFTNWLAGVERSGQPHKLPRRILMFDHLSKGRSGVADILRDVAIHIARRARDRELGDVYVILLECDEETADMLEESGGVCEDRPTPINIVHVEQFLNRVQSIRRVTGRVHSDIPEVLTKFVAGCGDPLDRQAVMKLSRHLREWYGKS